MSEIEQGLLTPIARQAVSEQVVHRILGLIQAGSLKRGDQLPPERELAAALGVSRPSLREALRALSLLGVLEIRQGDGVYVSSLSPEMLLAPIHFFIALERHHLDALFEARLILEPGIAGLAVERVTPEAVRRLEACVHRGEAHLDDPTVFLEADVEFHQIIVDAAGNPFLQRVVQSLMVLGRASREITVEIPGVRQQSCADHRAILSALAGRRPEAARAAMEQHLRNVQGAYHLQTRGGAS